MPREFTCGGCGALVLDRARPREGEPADQCGHCLAMPGWTGNPELRRLFGFLEQAPSAAPAPEPPR